MLRPVLILLYCLLSWLMGCSPDDQTEKKQPTKEVSDLERLQGFDPATVEFSYSILENEDLSTIKNEQIRDEIAKLEHQPLVAKTFKKTAWRISINTDPASEFKTRIRRHVKNNAFLAWESSSSDSFATTTRTEPLPVSGTFRFEAIHLDECLVSNGYKRGICEDEEYFPLNLVHNIDVSFAIYASDLTCAGLEILKNRRNANSDNLNDFLKSLITATQRLRKVCEDFMDPAPFD